MKVAKAHCMFEQSGTFKREFEKMGIPAIDYDILNDYGQTDRQIDLFTEIRNAYEDKPSVFDEVGENDIVLAFYPCTRFENKIQIWFRGIGHGQEAWTTKQRLQYSMKLHAELSELYEVITKMAIVAIDRKIRMIIENPYGQPHYLTQYWCLKPQLIDNNRRMRGDFMKKPTQYWFINCEPEYNLIFEGMFLNEIRIVDEINKMGRERMRSEIAPEYANRFIREFILDQEYINA